MSLELDHVMSVNCDVLPSRGREKCISLLPSRRSTTDNLPTVSFSGWLSAVKFTIGITRHVVKHSAIALG